MAVTTGRILPSLCGEHGMEGNPLDEGTWILRGCGDGVREHLTADGMGYQGMYGPSLQTNRSALSLARWIYLCAFLVQTRSCLAAAGKAKG